MSRLLPVHERNLILSDERVLKSGSAQLSIYSALNNASGCNFLVTISGNITVAKVVTLIYR